MLETRFVFIDTQVYVNLGFNVHNELFKKIKELGESGEIELITTTITIREVEANIKKRIQEELSSISKLKTSKQIPGVLNAINLMPSIDEASKALIEKFNTFLKDSNSTILPVDSNIAEEIFDKYFNTEPPFGTGKKKSEFPDAFVLGTISEHINGDMCYIISDDGDHISECITNDKLINFPKLANFLDAYNSHQEERKLIIKEWVSHNQGLIIDALTHAIDFEGFTCADSDDGIRQDYEIYDFEIISLSIDDLKLIDLSIDSAIVSVVIDAEIKIKYSYYDYEMAIYDKEDNRYFGAEREDRESKVNISLPCSFNLLIEESGDMKVDDLQIDDPDALEVSDQI